jgi:hypothetical protein
MTDQALTLWCSNNWRMERGVARKSNNFHPNRTEVVWNTRQEEVMQEIGRLLGVDNVTTKTPLWFTKHMQAIKHLIEDMTTDELNSLDIEVEEVRKKGYNEKQQRR